MTGVPKQGTGASRHSARTLLASVAVAALAVALGGVDDALAQSAPALRAGPSASGAESTSRALALLLRNARHNIQNGRADLAFAQLDTVLARDPANAEAQMLYVVAYASAKETEKATAALARLKQTHPTDVDRITRAENAIATGGKSGAGAGAPGLADIGGGRRIDPVVAQLGPDAGERIEAARTAVAAGDFDQAAKDYRAAVKGRAQDLPPAQAREYYETLAGSKAHIREAREGLRRLYGKDRDPATGLAYGKVLTYRESTRRQGIKLLAGLADDETVGQEAAVAWGQALIWLGARRSDLKRFDAYIARYPDDLEVRAAKDKAQSDIRRASRSGGRPSRSARARIKGFKLLEAGDLEGARAQFEAALKRNKRDRDALGGIGVILLKQDRFEEAEDYLKRAAVGSRRARWGEALGAARFWTAYRRAEAALQAGDFTGAERGVRPVLSLRGADAASGRRLLGDALMGQGRYREAERAYRSALAAAPGNAGAELGIFNALAAQNRFDEATTFSQTMGPDARASLGGLDGFRANVLRLEAERDAAAGRYEDAYRRYREAVALDPENPWARLELARLAVRLGNAGEGRALIEEMAASPDATDEDLQAAATFYEEQGQFAAAAAIARRIPTGGRTPAVQALIDRAGFAAGIARARSYARQGARGQAIAALERLAATAPTPERRAQVASALADLGAGDRALAIVTPMVQADSPVAGNMDIQILYAGILAQTGHEQSAQDRVAKLADAPLTRSQQEALAGVRRGLAIRYADRARKAGAFGDAFDSLSAELAAAPGDVDLLLALARLYAAAGQAEDAQTIYAQALQQDPANKDAVIGAIGAALEAGDAALATRLLDQAVVVYPDDPDVYFLVGEAANAQGDASTARKAFLTARALQQDALKTDAVLRSDAGLGANPFDEGVAVSPTSLAPVSDGPTGVAADPTLTARIDDRLEGLRGQSGAFVQGGVGFRFRDGDSGLDRKFEAHSPFSAIVQHSSAGKLTLTATPTYLRAGRLETSESNLRRYGLNPIAATGAVPNPGKVDAAGVGLSVAYDYEWISLDGGVTPLGFELINPVGGVELKPRLNDEITMSFKLEQRAVTDSVLSYAGVEDAVSGFNFGAVYRRGGALSLSFDVGAYGAYADAGYYLLDGDDVEDNEMAQANAGAFVRVINESDRELKIGGAFTFLSYDENLRHFTFRHGGYFSPQNYVSIAVPVEFTTKVGRLNYQVGGAVGIQHFEEDDAPIFPGDAFNTNRLNVLLGRGTLGTTALTLHPGEEETGVGFNIFGRMEYTLSDTTVVGAEAKLDAAADWHEGYTFFYLRRALGDGLFGER